MLRFGRCRLFRCEVTCPCDNPVLQTIAHISESSVGLSRKAKATPDSGHYCMFTYAWSRSLTLSVTASTGHYNQCAHNSHFSQPAVSA